MAVLCLDDFMNTKKFKRHLKKEALFLPNIIKSSPKIPVIGVFADSDPRVDRASRTRCRNIVKMAADCISGSVVLPDKTPVPVDTDFHSLTRNTMAPIAQCFENNLWRQPQN